MKSPFKSACLPFISYTPGYDGRMQPEMEQFGKHGLEINIGVRHHDHGALVFTVATGMYAWPTELSRFEPRGGVYCLCSHHRPVTDPHYDERDLHESCGWLGGEPCLFHEPWGCTGDELRHLYNTFVLEGPQALQSVLTEHLESLSCATT